MHVALSLLALAVPPAQDLDAAEGLVVETWASSPLLYNPTAMDVDPRGRLWVTEAVNYRKWNGRNPGREHPEGDRVVVLSDTDGDGRADTSKVFAQGPELVSPLGICVLGGQAVVALYRCHGGLGLGRDPDAWLGGAGRPRCELAQPAPASRNRGLRLPPTRCERPAGQ